MTLKKLSIETKSVNNGEELITTLQNEKFDIIFMDLLMPGLSGEETTALIRQHSNQQLNDIYIVACSANISETLDYDYAAKLMDDCLGKPINKANLVKVFQRFLEKN
jgi:CheY-like chemotaxis protein